MISVDEARSRLLALVSSLGAEAVPLVEAGGRVLREPVRAFRDQPPFAASAMDGYAIRGEDGRAGATLRVVGEAPAGRAFAGQVGPGEAVRIFTGAPLPEGTDTILIQEDTERNSDSVIVLEAPATGANVRPAGGDFHSGTVLSAPRRLSPADVALLAAMGSNVAIVGRRPVIALLATGDELVMPGQPVADDQIFASNTFGLRASFEMAGAEARLLPIARDTRDSLRAALAAAEGADLIVTVGGASVGDHDLVAEVATNLGLERSFYKVAMRPGKPLMAGRLGTAAMVGLPGNPVSAMVCGEIFIQPMINVMLGLPAMAPKRTPRPLGCPLPANGPREHYMRATIVGGEVWPNANQDSSLLTVLANADALAVRPPHDPARDAGDMIDTIPLGASSG